MSTPYGNDPQQPWGQQPYGQQQWGQQPQYPQSGPQPAQPQYPGYEQQQQWQQPQQYPGYEQPGGYQGGYGQYPSFEPEDGGKKSKAWLWITLTVVVLAAGSVAVLGFVAPGFFNTKILSGLEEGVVKIHGSTVQDVSCPDDIKVEKDATGECTATVNGEKKTIKITVVDADADPPKYEVGPPQ